MTVKEAIELVCSYEDFKLVGARTGKTLYSKRHNNPKRLELFKDKEVTDSPFYADIETNKNTGYLPHFTEYIYPVIAIWVRGE